MHSKRHFASLCLAAMTLAAHTQAQTAKIQIIHNCADAAADSVDVYVNGTLALNNFAFRTATPFISLPAGVPLSVGIAPKTSTSVADTIYNLNATLTANTTYLAVAQGIVSPTGYVPAPQFRVSVSALGQTQAAFSGSTDVMIVHGSTDAPTVDVRSGVSTLADDLQFGDFNSSYVALPTANYKVRITTPTGSNTVATYSAPLATLNLQDSAIVVVASGFLNPSANSNGASFGLWVALPTGGALIPLPTTTPESIARLQVIHNCADAAADSVDVYLNGINLLDNFAFRTATGFVDLLANTPLSFGIAAKNSTSVADTLYNAIVTLDSGARYIVVANGIVSPTGYNPAKPFGLSIYPTAREEAANNTVTDVLVVHGSTDAPTVDVRSGSNVLVNNISYNEFAGYLSLPVSDYIVKVTDTPGTPTVAAYSAPLQTLNLGGAAITVVASGFLNPAANSNGPGFGLWVAPATGGNLIPLPTAGNVNGVPGNRDVSVSVRPNPVSGTFIIHGLREASNATILDMQGRVLMRGLVKPSESIDASGLPAGMYLLQVGEGADLSRVKFVVQ